MIKRTAIKLTRAVNRNARRALTDPQRLSVWRDYRAISAAIKSVVKSPDTDRAVFVHLYYTESWPVIVEALQKLTDQFDLFISMPAHNQGFSTEITKVYPGAYIYTVPNRGRDVLPFVMLADEVSKKSYDYLLKIHSKKSTHRTDGQEWLHSMLEALLPQPGSSAAKELRKTLQKPTTGIVGPVDQYVPLTVNFDANGVHMTTIMRRLYGRSKTHEILQVDRANYGFFAGTMFWARCDAIQPLLTKASRIRNFDKEAGQIDGTMAHALERLFSVIPEVANRKMYQVGKGRVEELPYASTNVPDWSDVYVGPGAKSI